VSKKPYIDGGNRYMAKEIQDVLSNLLTKGKKTISVAESCTGGLIASIITNAPGSSVYFGGGVIAYSNHAKIDLLKVPERIIQEDGAVSRNCAVAMAKNIRVLLRTDIGLGVTGIAGPNGGSAIKPTGSVYIAVSDGDKAMCKLFRFEGGRSQVRQKASMSAIKMVNELISK